jgi:hypothetical protein
VEYHDSSAPEQRRVNYFGKARLQASDSAHPVPRPFGAGSLRSPVQFRFPAELSRQGFADKSLRSSYTFSKLNCSIYITKLTSIGHFARHVKSKRVKKGNKNAEGRDWKPRPSAIIVLQESQV